jgi:hypothetical protein
MTVRESSWLDRVDENISQLPEWARPPFYGMFLVYSLIAAKAIFALPILLVALLVGGPVGMLTAIWILIVAGLAGFAGGVAFSVVHPLLGRLGRFGALATGWVCAFAYLVTVLPVLDVRDPRYDRFDFHDPESWIVIVVMSLLAGSVLGGFFMNDERGRGRRQRWVQRRSRVTSRVHPPDT